jgi:hypothetical protein
MLKGGERQPLVWAPGWHADLATKENSTAEGGVPASRVRDGFPAFLIFPATSFLRYQTMYKPFLPGFGHEVCRPFLHAVSARRRISGGLAWRGLTGAQGTLRASSLQPYFSLATDVESQRAVSPEVGDGHGNGALQVQRCARQKEHTTFSLQKESSRAPGAQGLHHVCLNPLLHFVTFTPYPASGFASDEMQQAILIAYAPAKS